MLIARHAVLMMTAESVLSKRLVDGIALVVICLLRLAFHLLVSVVGMILFLFSIVPSSCLFLRNDKTYSTPSSFKTQFIV